MVANVGSSRVLFASKDLAYSLRGAGAGRYDPKAKLTLRVVSLQQNLKIELVHENDLGNEMSGNCFYYLLEITPTYFAQLKQEQSLRVDFANFSLQLVSLLERCLEENAGFRLGITLEGDGLCELCVLETTTFRELAHVSLSLTRATETQTRLFLFGVLDSQLLATSRAQQGLADCQFQYEQTLDALRKQLQQRDERIQALEADIRRLPELESELSRVRSDLTEQLSRQIAQTESAQSQLTSCQLQVNQAEHDNDSLRARNSQLTIEMEHTTKQLEQSQLSEASKDTELLNLSRQINDSSLSLEEKQRKNKVIQQQERLVEALRVELDQAKTAKRELESGLETEHAKLVECLKQVDILKHRLEVSKNTLLDNQQLISQLQGSLL
ncbi:hypothetical protein BASA81_008001 [Batrachochytrium salamandrivorans]|nr:hypothetical protein BASA81_008001 [Batrachochytrium salamandrivorans]